MARPGASDQRRVARLFHRSRHRGRLGALAVVGFDMREHDAPMAIDHVGGRQRQRPLAIAVDHRQLVADAAVQINQFGRQREGHAEGFGRTRNAWRFRTPDGSDVTVRVDAAFQTNSSEGVRAATVAGLGITYSPCWLFTDAVASKEVTRLLPEWSAPPLPIHLVTTPERRGAAKVKAFGDHVAAALQQTEPVGANQETQAGRAHPG
jgi:DNA-binding transcriptional LysR family regulator